jgi:RloB-like protein
MTGRQRSKATGMSRQPSRMQLLIFSEGLKTESLYLTNWHRLYRDRVIISIAPHEHTTPYELAESAAKQRRSDLREEKRGRGAAYDQYWCIFDVDEHPRIPEAIELARANSINVALSSPCVELWFLIHFVQQTGFLDRAEAQRRSKAVLGCDKVLTQAALDSLVQRYDTAKGHARTLVAKHEGDGSAQPWNPHTTVWRLVDEIIGTRPVA